MNDHLSNRDRCRLQEMSVVEDLSCQRGHWKLQKGRHRREKITKLRRRDDQCQATVRTRLRTPPTCSASETKELSAVLPVALHMSNEGDGTFFELRTQSGRRSWRSSAAATSAAAFRGDPDGRRFRAWCESPELSEMQHASEVLSFDGLKYLHL